MVRVPYYALYVLKIPAIETIACDPIGHRPGAGGYVGWQPGLADSRSLAGKPKRMIKVAAAFWVAVRRCGPRGDKVSLVKVSYCQHRSKVTLASQFKVNL